MYMILVGGGNVGIQLAKRLIDRGNEVLLIEKDATTAQKLANLLGDEFVMQGDGCEMYTQRKAGFNRADVVAAVTGEDEDNFVICQLSKELWHVDRVLARVNDPRHEDIFKDVGIDDTVSATGIIFNLLVQQISTDDLIPIGSLDRGNAEIVESVLSSRSTLIGRDVGGLELPEGAFIAFIVRDDVCLQPSAEMTLQTDDMLVALVPITRADELRDALCAKS